MTDQSPATYRVPATVEDMLPPKASSLITEAANFIRAHWDEIRPYYQAMSGEAPSKHGSYRLDEAAYTFEVKRLAAANGYALLGRISTYDLWRALRFGYRRNTGVSMKLLESQYKQLQVTHQQAS
jgi:hypothetical protein